MKIILHLSTFLILLFPLSCSAQSHEPSGSTIIKRPSSPLPVDPERLKKMYELESHYQRFSGVVQVRQGEEVLLQETFGGVDRGIPANLETRFDIGSISKSFTAVGILTLVHQGKLGLHDPINVHLGPYATDKWAKVTVHQLLTHTSGIPSIYQTEQGLPVFFPETGPIELEALIGRFREGKLLFKPGKEFSYSNSGYVLLAAIIEHVSQRPFQEFMHGQIFNKFDLQHTSFTSNALTAQPYFGYRQDLSRKAPKTHWSWAIGAGGIQTNLKDLSHWLQVIQSPDFLSSTLREAYFKQHVPVGYGYGWQFTREGRVQHDGGTAGYISFVSFDPKTGQRIIVMTNRSFKDIKQLERSGNYIRGLVDKTWKILRGGNIETLPAPGQLTQTSGSYEFLNGTRLTFKTSGDGSIWAQANVTPSRIIPSTSLNDQSKKELMMNHVANLLLRKKHWRLAKYCNGEMKFVCFSGLFGVGMKMIRNKTGAIHDITAYYADETYGLLRVIGKKQTADLIAYFDETGRIKGLFENGYYSLDQVSPMRAFPISDGGLLLDGFSLGEPDVLIGFQGEKIELTQSGRIIEGVRIPNH